VGERQHLVAPGLRRTRPALPGGGTGESTLVPATLIANLVALAIAVAELREPRQRAAQAAAARAAATHLHAAASPPAGPMMA
jgi:hypothetical protein